MKKIIIFTALLFINSIFSQTKCSISIAPHYAIAVGDNFLNKGYGNNMGVQGEVQLDLFKTNLFAGINYRYSDESVADTKWVGSIKSANSNATYYYAGYKHNLKNQKLYLEYRIGYGKKSINNKTNINDYQITGRSYIIGSKFNYVLSNKINAFCSLEYHYSKYDVDVADPYHDFYNTSKQIIPAFGIKFIFL